MNGIRFVPSVLGREYPSQTVLDCGGYRGLSDAEMDDINRRIREALVGRIMRLVSL